ncbi:uncharacterized protein LOC132835012 [Hemiscyllium ocellatum]|uniref:uncharacterized protein LOC132835012 n=1 Tax=Hemiscyllium ocellatum TaxID=170820 RepID=UPI002965DC6E|nr:uncharacterized protein LOC132835012 [Hemiscyllium ocellatum]
MKVKQLIPVDHLPTIFETHDEGYHDTLYGKGSGLSSDCHPPQTQDDYLKSICQLAQPTFLFDTSSKTQNAGYANTLPNSAKQTTSHRHKAELPSPVSLQSNSKKDNCFVCALADAFSLDTITIAVSSSRTPSNNADPFSWLFGRSHIEIHGRINRPFPQQRSLPVYTNEAKSSRKTRWLSLDHMVMAENGLHRKQPQVRGKIPSTGCSTNIRKGKPASSEYFFHYHQGGNEQGSASNCNRDSNNSRT